MIADAYDGIKHDPNNPDVKSAYGALINETNQQFSDLLDNGLQISANKPGESPYKNSEEMHKDIKDNNHLSFFPTEQGFGEGDSPKDHPMLAATKFELEGKPLLANDVFRVVHDINGHNRGEPSGFGPKGEHQAFLTHKQMFSPEATKALFTETAGQNNWVNFGPFGKQNRKDPANTKFSDQKAGLFPNEIISGKFHL